MACMHKLTSCLHGMHVCRMYRTVRAQGEYWGWGWGERKGKHPSVESVECKY